MLPTLSMPAPCPLAKLYIEFRTQKLTYPNRIRLVSWLCVSYGFPVELT